MAVAVLPPLGDGRAHHPQSDALISAIYLLVARRGKERAQVLVEVPEITVAETGRLGGSKLLRHLRCRSGRAHRLSSDLAGGQVVVHALLAAVVVGYRKGDPLLRYCHPYMIQSAYGFMRAVRCRQAA